MNNLASPENKLIIVGTGIKSISHITLESQKVIRDAEHCLYLVTDNYLKKWVERESKSCESLDGIYFDKTKRIDAYVEISNYIVSQFEKYSTLCVIFYGHPTFFAMSPLMAANEIIKKGGQVVVLPGVSSFDTLCSDLMIDPGRDGCAFFEATDFLIYKRIFDVRSHLVIYQAGALASFSHNEYKDNINILADYLVNYYGSSHKITLYEASTLPSVPPVITTLSIDKLSAASVGKLTTLHIPPLKSPSLNNEMVSKLGINLTDFIPT